MPTTAEDRTRLSVLQDKRRYAELQEKKRQAVSGSESKQTDTDGGGYTGIRAAKPSWRQGVSEKFGIGEDVLFPSLTGGVFTQAAERKVGKLSEGIKEEGAPFVGETVGEMAGSKFGPKGRILGAGIGRAAGQGIKQFYQAIMNDPKAPRTVKEAALRELEAFAVGAGTEAVSETVIGAGRKIGAGLGFKSTITKPYPNIGELDKVAKRAGINFTPAERTVSRPIDTFEEIAENAFFGRGGLHDIKEISHPAGVRRAVDQMMDMVLPKGGRVGREELGELIEDVIQDRHKAFKQAGSGLYKRVDRITRPSIKTRMIEIDVPSAILDESGKPFIRTTKKKVQEEVGGALTDISQIKKIAVEIQQQRLKEGGPRIAVDDLVDNILSRPSKVNFKSAHNIRSDFMEVSRNAPSKKDRIAGLSGHVASIIDRQMSVAAKQLSPDAYKAWRTANAFWKTGKETFNSKVIRRTLNTLLDETPDKVADMIFQAKSPKQIRTIMQLAADPGMAKGGSSLLQRRLRSTFLDNIVEKSSGQIPGDVSDLRTLLGRNFIDHLEKYGDDALKEIFTSEELKRVRNVARVAKITQGKPGGAGGFLIQLIQAGPLAGVAGGVVTGQPTVAKKSIVAAVPISGFTYGLSRLLQSPRGSKILTDMMDVSPNTPMYYALANRLTREMYQIDRATKEGEMREEKIRKLSEGAFGAKGY